MLLKQICEPARQNMLQQGRILACVDSFSNIEFPSWTLIL